MHGERNQNATNEARRDDEDGYRESVANCQSTMATAISQGQLANQSGEIISHRSHERGESNEEGEKNSVHSVTIAGENYQRGSVG